MNRVLGALKGAVVPTLCILGYGVLMSVATIGLPEIGSTFGAVAEICAGALLVFLICACCVALLRPKT